MGIMTPLQIVMKAGLAGFSFGSEPSYYRIVEDALHLSIVMLLQTRAHLGCWDVCFHCIWRCENSVLLEQNSIVKHATKLGNLMNYSFGRANLPFIVMTVMLSMIDCPLLQFLPWNDTPFFVESKGFHRML